ncbi:MAG: murein L,D-transpeptidase catalytic domain family protein [Bdellovibrio sp.]|nr:murein L,D-transpeptidase catalytic domain family protein [Bdellovibrio sp.]
MSLEAPVKVKYSMMSIVFSLIALTSHAAPSNDILKKITDQGVPVDALSRLVKFMDDYQGRTFQQQTYTCAKLPPESIKPCEESERTPSTSIVTLANPELVVIIDFSRASTEKRFFFINLKTGEVMKHLVSHGIGSGNSNYASRFSNIKDSRQTSLGIYLAGDTYMGKYGRTLRLYGLQGSNDQAYNRDIVLHGAWYAADTFPDSINPKTGQKFGRLGVSWGCPALPTSTAAKLIPMLKNGSLVMHYFGSLMDDALTGQEVSAPTTDRRQTAKK